jgi:tRNA A-37 threonylcarbamoyl transferase component Bud32
LSLNLDEQLQIALGDAYLLERELGGGGMSRVFLAHDKALGRRVVVKVLLPELAAGVNVDRFRREILLAAQLQHPHIVPLLSAGEAGSLPYFIMPFVAGESLRARMGREGELPIADTVRILRDVVSALAYAHSCGVVHRDVKPDNVLISGGVAVVTDFGVAKAVSVSSDFGTGNPVTTLGVALGTPTYMAPEQATASPQTDHRADIYALGAMAYEMLAGTPPFAGRSPQAMLAAHVMEEPEPVERRRPVVPSMLAGLVRDCLAKRPADRPQTAVEVMYTLDAIATPTGGTVPTTVVRARTLSEGTPLRRRRIAGAIVALALLVAVAGVLWQWRRPSEPVAPVAPAAEPPVASLPVADSARPVPPDSPPDKPAPEAVRPRVPTEPPPPRVERRPTQVPRPVIPRDTAVEPAVEPAVRPPLPIDSAPSPISPPIRAAVESAPPPVPETTRAAVPPAPAPPPRPVDPRPEIRGLIAQYAGAVEAENLSDLRRVYPGMTPVQQHGWEQFFQLVRDVKAQLDVDRLDVTDSKAEAQVRGIYTYLNTSTQRSERQPVSFSALLRREGGRWNIVEIR